MSDQGDARLGAAERRRQRKLEQAATKKCEKEAKKANETNTSTTSYKEDEEIDPTKYFDNRLAQLAECKARGVDIYPHKWHVSMSLPDYVNQYKDLGDGDHRSDVEVSLAGRIMRVAGSGAAMRFYDLVCDDTKVQVMALADNHDPSLVTSFADIHNSLRRGDFIGVRGFPGKSKRGELSIFPKETMLLSACLHMLPKPQTGLKDQEIRYRQRYLDLLINPEVKSVFRTRARIIQIIRSYFDNLGFLEVETPMMHQIQGGANARPFVTYHNELNQNLFLRIAPELYLKMLIVGGMDRVFEIGKNFRNEGVDMTHNPEFTAIEFYMTYADYNDVLSMTELLISTIVMTIHGTYKIAYHPEGPTGPEKIIDFTPPYPRVSFVEEIEKRAGVSLPRPLDGEKCIAFMKDLCNKHKLVLPSPANPTKLLDKLCGYFIEDQIVNPTFVGDHPQIMSPLAKWHRSRPEATERCELFICGREIANFYTEMNDPIRQRALFEEQSRAKDAGDDEACPVDENFLRSLEYGLPPTAGWGLGIDRLVMFLTDRCNIKDVIPFPAMRPVDDTQKTVQVPPQ